MTLTPAADAEKKEGRDEQAQKACCPSQDEEQGLQMVIPRPHPSLVLATSKASFVWPAQYIYFHLN